jgi:hypothetical protein
LYSFAALSFWNLSEQILALECYHIASTLTFYIPFLLPVLLQPVVLVAATVTWALEKYQPIDIQAGFRATQATRKLRFNVTHSVVQMSNEFWTQLVSYNIDALSLSYIPALAQALMPFSCQQLGDGSSVMLIHPDVQCWSMQSTTWIVSYVLPSLVFGSMYLVGVPWLLGYLLYLRHQAPNLALSLARSYYPLSYWWWGVLVLLEHTSMVVIIMVVSNWIAQLVLLTLVLLAMIGTRIWFVNNVHPARLILHILATVTTALFLLFVIAALITGAASDVDTVTVSMMAATCGILIALAAVVSFILRRRMMLFGNEMADELFFVLEQSSGIRSVLVEDEIIASWEINYSKLKVLNPPIAKGGYGVVNRAIYNGTLVAVKTLFCDEFDRDTSMLEFKREIKNLWYGVQSLTDSLTH